MGLDFDFVNGEGPVRCALPVRTLRSTSRPCAPTAPTSSATSPKPSSRVAKHFAAPRPPETSASDPAGDQLGIIGFIGAPFTLASYMIEGGSSRNYIETKRLMYASSCEGAEDSKAWPLLVEKLVTVLIAYARQQVEAGADVIQVFDSWAGALSVPDYTTYCLPATKLLIEAIRNMGVPVIYFGVDTASLLPAMQTTGADVLGLDWRIPLAVGRRVLGAGTAVQGNLDPITLFAPPKVIETRVAEILQANAGQPGHIFNLGHGIVPTTPVEAVLQVVAQMKASTPTQPSKPS